MRVFPLLELVLERQLGGAGRMTVEPRQIVRGIELVGTIIPLCVRASVEDVENPEGGVEPPCPTEVEFATEVQLQVARGLVEHLTLAAGRIRETPRGCQRIGLRCPVGEPDLAGAEDRIG